MRQHDIRNSYNHNKKGTASFLGGPAPKYYEEYSPEHVRNKYTKELSRRSVEMLPSITKPHEAYENPFSPNKG